MSREADYIFDCRWVDSNGEEREALLTIRRAKSMKVAYRRARRWFAKTGRRGADIELAEIEDGRGNGKDTLDIDE
jgi:hypothetical protein